jgi:hypothetical protein
VAFIAHPSQEKDYSISFDNGTPSALAIFRMVATVIFS